METKEMKWKEKNRRSRREKGTRILSFTYAVSVVFCTHIEFKSSNRDKHTHNKNIQIQILYKFEIQFNYWLNFKLNSNGSAWVSGVLRYVCVCSHADCTVGKWYNRNENFLLNHIDSCVFLCIPKVFLFFMVFQQQNNSLKRKNTRTNQKQQTNEWTSE